MAWPALDPGRLLERCGDVAPRRMTVHDRTRLTGRLRRLRSGVRPSRRRPRFVPPQAVQNAGPAPGIPHPRGCRRAPLTQGGLQVGRWSRLRSLVELSLRVAAFVRRSPFSKAPAFHTAAGDTKRESRSGHSTSPRLSPRPFDARGLAGRPLVEALATRPTPFHRVRGKVPEGRMGACKRMGACNWQRLQPHTALAERAGEQRVEGVDDDLALVFRWSAGIGVNIELDGHRVENPSAKELCTSVKAFHSLAARCSARALALRLSRSLVTYSVKDLPHLPRARRSLRGLAPPGRSCWSDATVSSAQKPRDSSACVHFSAMRMLVACQRGPGISRRVSPWKLPFGPRRRSWMKPWPSWSTATMVLARVPLSPALLI